MNRKLWKLACALLLSMGSASLLASPVTERELRTDCETEGKAVGMSGSDLEEYIKDCMAEFAEADMSSNINSRK